MILTRYLAREVYTAMLAAIVVLLFIFLSNQFVRYLHYAALGHLSSHAVMLVLLLQLPILSAVLLPLSLYLAILLAYGRMYADNEMTVITACGVSPYKLLKTTVSFSIIIFVIVAALTFWLNPKVYNYYDHITSGATSSATELLQPNKFNDLAKGKWIFYVAGANSEKKTFSQIFAAQQPTGGAPTTQAGLGVVTAAQAEQRIDLTTGETYLVLKNGYRYSGTPGQKDYEMIKYSEYGVKMQSDATWQPDESSKSTAKLWHNRHERLAAAELQWRISLPLSALILTLVATPLSRVRPRKGRYAQLAPAVLCYIIYVNFLILTKAWIKKGVLVPWLGMWWVHGAMLICAAILIWRQLRTSKR